MSDTFTGPTTLTGESRVPQIIVGNLLPFLVATPFVFARFWSRILILKKFTTEDWCLLVAWISSLLNTALAIAATNYGAGHHELDIPMSFLAPFFKNQYVSRIFYQLAISMVKISLCVMYLRIFGTQLRDKIFLWFCNGLLITSTIGLLIFNIFQCNPISKNWNIFMKTGHCANDIPGFWTSFAVSIITDVLLLVYSQLKVKSLQMAKRQKIAMFITVGLGWIVVIFGILRCVKIARVIKDSTDASWRTYDTSIYSTVEINIAILCTSAIAIKPLLKQLAPSFMRSVTSKAFQSVTPRSRASPASSSGGFSHSKSSSYGKNGSNEDIEIGKIYKAREVIVIEEDEECMV